VFVRSFADSDGDGIGDLRGLIDRLDYLNDGDPATSDDLGVTGIWLMPVFESPSYHGYDVTDYRRIEPDYGTLEDFRALLDAAHEREMAVIVDLVLNHTSRSHPWFGESLSADPEYADWYVWSDTDPGWSGPEGQQVWHHLGGRWYYALFWEGMPDLNLRNPAVTEELHDVARYWIEDVGVDGFRVDAAKHFIEVGRAQENTPETREWLAAFQDSVEEARADVLVLGEVWSSTEETASYIPGSLDLVFEFGLAEAILLAVEAGNASPIEEALADLLTHYPAGQYATFLTNHDQERVMSRLVTEEKAAAAAALLLTLPGVPFVYYGEEIGLSGRKPDPRLRTPMPWTGDQPGVGFSAVEPWEPPQDGFEEVNVAAQQGDPGSLLSWYRDLISIRAAHPALRYGDLIPVETGTSLVAAYLRTIGDDHVLVAVNVSRLATDGYSLDLGSGPFEGAVAAVSLLDDEAVAAPSIGPDGGFAGYRPLAEIPARGVLVIELVEE
jgi:glycosidase